jgi:hypothetical protein
MAITQTVTNYGKVGFISGSHTPLHTYKIALYTSAATLDATTSTYSATNEVVGTGYTAGGLVLTGYNIGVTAGGVSYLSFTSPSWPAASITARGATIYNTSGTNVIGVLNFSVDYISTSGTFAITFPSASLITLT